MKRFSAMVEIVDGLRRSNPRSEWQFVTLTVENCAPHKLGETLDAMATAWDKIMRRRTMKRTIIGWARSLEITYNAQTRTLHPHYHVLCLVAPEVSGEDQSLSQAWVTTIDARAVMAAQNTQKIEAMTADAKADDPEEVVGAILETYKYTVKSKDLQEMPLWAFRELAQLIKGRRLVAFGGVVKEYAALLKDLDLDEEPEDGEDEEELTKCASCGSVRVIEIVGKWTGDGYLWRRTPHYN